MPIHSWLATFTTIAVTVLAVTFALLQCFSITDSLRNKFGIVMAVSLTEAYCVKVHRSIRVIAASSNATQTYCQLHNIYNEVLYQVLGRPASF